MKKIIEGIVENNNNAIYVKATGFNQTVMQSVIDEFNDISTSFISSDNATSFLIRMENGPDVVLKKGNRMGFVPTKHFVYFIDIYTGSDDIREYTRIMMNSKKEATAAFCKIESMLNRTFINDRLHYFVVKYLVDGEIKMTTQKNR